jgi:hypothetical protein
MWLILFLPPDLNNPAFIDAAFRDRKLDAASFTSGGGIKNRIIFGLCVAEPTAISSGLEFVPRTRHFGHFDQMIHKGAYLER